MGRTHGAKNKPNPMKGFRRMTNIVDAKEEEERRRQKAAEDARKWERRIRKHEVKIFPRQGRRRRHQKESFVG